MMPGLVVVGGSALIILCGLWWRARRANRRLGRLVSGGRRSRAYWAAVLRRNAEPRPLVLACGCATLTVGVCLAAGPVAGFVAAAYSGVAAYVWHLARQRARAERLRYAALDAIGGLAAELRAGLPQPEALPAELVPQPTDPVVARAAERLTLAIGLSQSVGAPLADLLDRVEHDLRAGLRLRALVAAETSAARATALLLAALPVAGTLLGVGFGVNPLDTLLHTRFGAGCVVAAVVMQLGGLAWSAWLSRDAIGGLV
jgi:tight adherence protein B